MDELQKNYVVNPAFLSGWCFCCVLMH